MHDKYDFTKIRTLMDGRGFGFAEAANDGGFISSCIDAINPYEFDIYFTITI